MNNTLAPIALFCFNRPEHLKETLNSLKNNLLSNKSIIYIFSDNFKSTKDKIKVEKGKKNSKAIRWI